MKVCPTCQGERPTNRSHCKPCHAKQEYARIQRMSESEREEKRVKDRARFHRETPEQKVEKRNYRNAAVRKHFRVKRQCQEWRAASALYQRDFRKKYPGRYKKTPEQKARDKSNKQEAQQKMKLVPEKMELRRRRSRESYERRKQNAAFKSQRRESGRRQKQKPLVRLVLNLRRRLVLAIRGHAKSAATFKLLGCSQNDLRAWIERQFSDGMTWDNYGKHGWNLDHKIPCARFDLSQPDQQRDCFHYTNLQPMWARENSSKKDRDNASESFRTKLTLTKFHPTTPTP